MPIIGEHFPMTRAARKEKLSCIKKGNSISNAKVPSQGSKPVYRIPLQYLSYNPYNTRFLAQAKTLERKFGQELSDENPEHVVEIEKLIVTLRDGLGRKIYKVYQHATKDSHQGYLGDGRRFPWHGRSDTS